MSGFGEDFKFFRIIIWHSVDLTDGRIRLMPNIDGFKMKLIVALIGNSSHCLTKLATALPKFSTTHVLLKSAMVKCQERFDSARRW